MDIIEAKEVVRSVKKTNSLRNIYIRYVYIFERPMKLSACASKLIQSSASFIDKAHSGNIRSTKKLLSVTFLTKSRAANSLLLAQFLEKEEEEEKVELVIIKNSEN